MFFGKKEKKEYVFFRCKKCGESDDFMLVSKFIVTNKKTHYFLAFECKKCGHRINIEDDLPKLAFWT